MAAPTAAGAQAPASPEQWLAVFSGYVDRLIHDEETVKRAIDGIVAACGDGHVEDRPASAIAQIYESHNKTRVEALKALSEFVVVCGGDLPPNRARAEVAKAEADAARAKAEAAKADAEEAKANATWAPGYRADDTRAEAAKAVAEEAKAYADIARAWAPGAAEPKG